MPAKVQTRYSLETIEAAAALLELQRRDDSSALTKPIWKPNVGAQTLAYNSLADELYYGGAAGGGKTDLLIGLATVRHYRSIIFRREFPQLSDIIERSREILSVLSDLYGEFATIARNLKKPPSYNAQEHKWRGLPQGRQLTFASVPHEKDKEKYQGRPHDFKGFDEISQFTKGQYTYIIGWLRTTNPNVRPRIVATGNPPMTPEAEWVLQYWGAWLDSQHPNPARPGELRWYATIAGVDTEVETSDPIYVNGVPIRPRSRTFIPARLADNPFYANGDYASVLNALPEPMRSKLLFGDSDIRPEADEWQVIPTEWINLSMQRWRKNQGYQTGVTAIGLDVARGGKDKTCVAVLHSNIWEPIFTVPGTDTPDGDRAAAAVPQALGIVADDLSRDAGSSRWYGTLIYNIPIMVDVVGVGASAYDALVHGQLEVYGVNGSAPSYATDTTGKLRMLNLRAEAYWRLREALDPVYGQDLALPDDRELAVELAAARWQPAIRGIQIEDKDKIKERIGRSPDKADAIALSFLDMRAKQHNRVPQSSSGRSYGGNLRYQSSQEQDPADAGGVPRRTQQEIYEDLGIVGPDDIQHSGRVDIGRRRK